ncbi:MAG: SDR family oxidoreductase [Bdellovibrionota bacterium]
MSSPLTFKQDSVALVVGVGLMGQDLARGLLEHVKPKKLILVDASEQLNVAGTPMTLERFAAGLDNPGGAEIVTLTANIADEAAMAALFAAHKDVGYIVITSGISPRPLTPPEQMDQAFYTHVFTVNTWGPINVINEAVKAGALADSSRGVILLSTASLQGAQGRANNAYEVSKWGLRGWLVCQAHHYLTQHNLVLNGISPNPLQGPMAVGNPVSASRVQRVIEETPLGLTRPEHITGQTLFFLADECNSAGQVITTCGGYTIPRPVYGYLPGDGPSK